MVKIGKQIEIKKPTLLYSMIALLCIIAFMACGYIFLRANFAILLFLGWLIAAAFAMGLGYKFTDIEGLAYESAKKGVAPAAIIMAVGLMIASFMAAGTVPTVLVLGLKAINPSVFLLVTFILCCITSLITGTSWGTIGTVGVAMIGVGTGLGANLAITAGAIVSGAYFGDKMSPISDSTILASTMTGTELWTHIKNMLWTTIPGAVICMILYTALGFSSSGSSYDKSVIDGVITSINSIYHIDFLAVLPLLVVIVLIGLRASTVGSLLIGSVLASTVAVVHQGYSLKKVAGFLYSGFVVDSDNAFLTGILNRGGLTSMMSLVAMIFVALGLGGIISETGLLQPVFEAITKGIRSAEGVLLMAWVIVWICVFIVPTYNFAFVLVPTLFNPLMKQYHLKTENLSRILEDVGTLGGNILPWCVGPVFATGVLGVPTAQYWPYVFLSILVPVISLIFIITGFKTKFETESVPQEEAQS